MNNGWLSRLSADGDGVVVDNAGFSGRLFVRRYGRYSTSISRGGEWQSEVGRNNPKTIRDRLPEAMLMTIAILKDASDKVVSVQAGESCDVVVTFQDAAGAAIAKASIISLTVTLFDETASSVINSRNAQSVLDANDGTVASDGTLTLRLGPSDSVIVGSVDVGDTQRHVLRLTWTWNDGVSVRTGIDQWVILVERIASAS